MPPDWLPSKYPPRFSLLDRAMILRVVLSLTLLWLLALAQAVTCAADPAAAKVDFNRDVRPILANNCFACHGPDANHREAELRLDTFEGATADRRGSRAIVPLDLAQSALWERVSSTDPDVMMPPPAAKKPPLSQAQRDTLKSWIEEGAVYQRHWSLEPPKKVAVPEGRHPIDHFIEARLKEKGLTLSPPADVSTLIRRVSLDLTGLPPDVVLTPSPNLPLSPSSPQERESGGGGQGEKAYEEAVDRLLASEHYGERWGRWWLDQARYADSNGYSIDAPRQIWKFRDWVIGALNADMPFDQFTIEQLAGDLLPDATDSQRIATGFHRNTQINQEGGIDREQFRVDSVFDRVATTGTVWLGLSIGCAQCHDHKFDPITQQEYYRLFAFLNNQEEPTLKVYDPGIDVSGLTAEQKDLETKLSAYMKEHAEELAKWEAGLTEEIKKGLADGVRNALAAATDKRSFDQNRTLLAAGIGAEGAFREWNDRYAEIDAVLSQGVTTLVMKELPKPRKTTVFIKGDFTRPAEEVAPGTPAILHPLETNEGQPNRLDLAKWLVSPQNPLTARVIVNRIWQQYFGRGIVETENDFGTQGTPPSHPELLDWLAVELVEQKWSLKALHRLIVTSRTYRQSSADRPELREIDPGNYLLGRQQRLRLDAEIVRDVALAASGLLVPKLGGPPVYPPIPDGVLSLGQVKRDWPTSQGEDRYRRGIYTFVYRATPPPSLNVFDAPDGYNTCTRRIRSNTPLQALTLLNDAAFFECAAGLEKIIRKEGLAAAFCRCTSRLPTTEERAVLEKLDTLSAARVLLNLDETVTRE